MFSPFHDEQGTPKTLADVAFADLAQLRELEEGFALEFKQTFSASVRRKIPKIVASFANSRGGWLVIGLSDAEKDVCPVPRPVADVSQTIGELCRRHVSPAPRFDARFLSDPTTPEQGVILVQVYEGDFPPYVADGVVEIREGSTSGPAAGTALVDLYDKATRRRLEVRAFCRRTVHYPMAAASPGELPLFNLYLFRMGREAEDAHAREHTNACAAAMREAFSQQGLSCRVQHAHDSLVFRMPARNETVVPHSAIELFDDESMKLSVPAVLLEGDERDRALDTMTQRALFPPAEGARLIDAPATMRRVTRMASLLDRYVRVRGIPWTEYAVAYELENMAGVTLWSDDETYLAYAERHGVLYCATTDCLSRVRYLDDGAHDTFRARQFAGSHFFEACGLPLGSPDPEDNRLVDALLHT
ncbi:ATP-binding protein [Olsenella profusa]|uniref:ATP-binding protein n=1 Tax=Olsenella profusa TaxID=138595 RepID=A0ABS2F0R9_9ACTN|nr:ATP-binding protein [Olsenella profusa]MBM6774560.1 ATP-binding protein [Olsenella profusa]